MLLALLPALKSRIGKMADFLTVKHRPFLTVKNIVKLLNKFRFFKIDKSIADIALELKVNWKVKEVKLASESLMY